MISGRILIDMSAMNLIIAQPGRASVRVGGGVIACTLQEALQSYGLFTRNGQAKSVGDVSWACGGGYGFCVRTYGFGVHQILGARVALASHDVIDTVQDPELLWAPQEAGVGSFSAITGLHVKVYPTPELYAGFLTFPLADTPTVLGPNCKVFRG